MNITDIDCEDDVCQEEEWIENVINTGGGWYGSNTTQWKGAYVNNNTSNGLTIKDSSYGLVGKIDFDSIKDIEEMKFVLKLIFEGTNFLLEKFEGHNHLATLNPNDLTPEEIVKYKELGYRFEE